MTPARPYSALSAHLHARFGAKVRSVTIDAGFTCPNVDGSVTTGGCVYCDNRSFSPNRRLPRATVTEQVQRGKAILGKVYGATKFIAYFQAGTNTHGPLDKLRRLYDEATAVEGIVALAIGTRPDSVPDAVLDLLCEYAERLPVFLELGLQTIHDRSLVWMNRGHGVDAYYDAVARCHGRPLELSAHVILGLPGETHADMMATADVIAADPLHSVKIHNLYVVKGTPLEEMYERGEARMFTREEYVATVCDFVERLPARMVMHRLSGDAPDDYLVAPLWCRDKSALLREIEAEFSRRGSRQGDRFAGGARRIPTRVGLPMASVT